MWEGMCKLREEEASGRKGVQGFDPPFKSGGGADPGDPGHGGGGPLLCGHPDPGAGGELRPECVQPDAPVQPHQDLRGGGYPGWQGGVCGRAVQDDSEVDEISLKSASEKTGRRAGRQHGPISGKILRSIEKST